MGPDCGDADGFNDLLLLNTRMRTIGSAAKVSSRLEECAIGLTAN